MEDSTHTAPPSQAQAHEAPHLLADSDQSILAATSRRREQHRRQVEMTVAAIGFVAVIIITFIQLNMFYAGDRLFVALFNVNFVILICVLVIVVRNMFKLFMERRRHVLGSGLRARLVLAFVTLTVLPCALMLLVTTKYVQVSMDFWFKEQIQTSMHLALNIGQDVFDRTERRLTAWAKDIATELRTAPEADLETLTATLDRLRNIYKLDYIAISQGSTALLTLSPQGNSGEILIRALEEMRPDERKEEVPEGQSAEQTLIHTTLAPGFDGDYLICAVPLSLADNTFVITAENLGAGFSSKVDRIAKGANEYKGLNVIKRPMKRLLYSSLGVLASLIMLGAVWVAFRIARQISAPVLAVAEGAKRVSQGDLTVRLEASATDELATLIETFNKMAQDLEASRGKITGINTTLEEQNKKIARHSAYVETVLNSIAAGVVSFDAGGRVTTVNKAACEMLLLQPALVIGKRPEDVLPEPQATMAGAVHRQFSSKLRTRGQYTFPLMVKGEERRLLVTVVGFATDGVYSGSVAVFEDISEVERMQRIAAWREVARRIAHEIKNPLTPIKLSAERLARKFGAQVQDPAFSQGTRLIVEQVEHLQSMVEEFSSFAKLPEVHPKPGNMAGIVTSVVDFFRSSHPGIHWETDIEENLPAIPLDTEAINRVFMNLCSNSVEAFSVQENNHSPTVRVSVHQQPELGFVHINLEDNGPGLTEEERKRLFEPYFTHKKGGTGLGMAIVRSLVTDHRGYVRALPRPGGGLVVAVELPLS